MSRKNSTCIDCNCKEISHTIERHGRNLIMEEINYSCGARQKETIVTDSNIGKVEFLGCHCGDQI